MVALACGHLVCIQDFQKLGGNVGEDALLSAQDAARLRQERAEQLRAQFGTTFSELIQALRLSCATTTTTTTSEADDSGQAEAVLALLTDTLECTAGADPKDFARAGGPAAVAQALQRFPRSPGVLHNGCHLLVTMCCPEHRPPPLQEQLARTVLQTPGIVRACVDALGSERTGLPVLYSVFNLLGTLFTHIRADVEQIETIVGAILVSMTELHPDESAVLCLALDVLITLFRDGPDDFWRAVVRLKAPKAIANAMRRHPNDELIQAYGIGALCHASFSVIGGVDVRAVGGIELTCQAMQHHSSVWKVQHNGCNFLWATANCPNKQKKAVKKDLLANGAVLRIKECMVMFPGCETIQQQACSALENLAHMLKPMPLAITRAGCIDAIVHALEQFRGLENASTSHQAVLAISRLASSNNPEVRLALTTSNAIPALHKVSDDCYEFCMAGIHRRARSTTVDAMQVMVLDELLNGVLTALGTLDISMLGDDDYDFDNEEVEDGPIEAPPFDVTSILGKDLSADDVAGWYKNRPLCIDYERSDQLATSHNKTFLLPPWEPQVDANVCIRVSLPYGGRGYLYGPITEVAVAPTDEDLRASGSELFEHACPCTNPDCPLQEGSRQEILSIFGAVDGQEVTATVSLASPYLERKLRFQPLPGFFLGEDSRYDAVLRWDEKSRKWVVVRISTAAERN